jgi:hypothetical protein
MGYKDRRDVAIDDAAAMRGLTRSPFLSSAAREKITAEG